MNIETSEHSPRPRQGDDLDVRIIVRVAGVFIGGLALALLLLALLFKGLEHAYPHRTSEAAPQVPTSQLPPLPRVQIDPAADLASVHAAEDRHLTRYAWINPSQSVGQIPIDRAMALWVKSQGTSPTNATPVTELQMRQDKAKEAPHAP